MVDLSKEEHGTAMSQRGIVGWLMDAWNARKSLGERAGKQLQLIEMLPLGAKRQLMLVRCGKEHFLVGGGLENISTIVKVNTPEAIGL